MTGSRAFAPATEWPSQEGWTVCVFRAESVLADPAKMLSQLVFELRQRGWDPGAPQLARVHKRINYISMQRRLARER